MSTISILNLEHDSVLDRNAMQAIQGGAGNSWLAGFGPLANVNVAVNQNITQMQQVDVNTLNNVGVIGSGFGPLRMDVSPIMLANVATVF